VEQESSEETTEEREDGKEDTERWLTNLFFNYTPVWYTFNQSTIPSLVTARQIHYHHKMMWSARKHSIMLVLPILSTIYVIRAVLLNMESVAFDFSPSILLIVSIIYVFCYSHDMLVAHY
jgi:hypothetical protein